MNNKAIVFVILGLLVAGVCGFLGGKLSVPSVELGVPVHNKVGATIGYLSSVGQQLTFNAFGSLLSDIIAVRTPAATISVYSSSSVTFGALGPSGVASSSLGISSSTASSTIGSGGDPVVGDLVLLTTSNATATIQKGVVFSGAITSTGTITVWATQPSSTGIWAGGTIGINAIVFPKAGFVVPATLISSTSTTTN